MPFCYELNRDLCGLPIRNAVNIAFFHLIIHGIFVPAFVFSNTCYPTFYYVDYMYGISGGILIPVAILGGIFAALKNCQPLRSTWAAVIVLNVLTVIVTSIWYTSARWDDVISTAFTRAIRKPVERDFPDYFWFALAVTGCVMLLPFLIYLVYIMSFMCNKWNSHLFTYNFELSLPQIYGPFYGPAYSPQISVPQVPPSNAYPTQTQKTN